MADKTCTYVQGSSLKSPYWDSQECRWQSGVPVIQGPYGYHQTALGVMDLWTSPGERKYSSLTSPQIKDESQGWPTQKN